MAPILIEQLATTIAPKRGEVSDLRIVADIAGQQRALGDDVDQSWYAASSPMQFTRSQAAERKALAPGDAETVAQVGELGSHQYMPLVQWRFIGASWHQRGAWRYLWSY